MNMKMRYLKWTCICAVLCIVVLALMGATENPETKMVKDLLEKRIVVMENVLFGKITYDEGKKQLKDIEEGEIFQRDLKSFVEFKHTDLTPVTNMEIISMKKESHIYDMMTFRGEIRWEYRGPDGSFYETNLYKIGISEKDKKWKLVSFEIMKTQ